VTAAAKQRGKSSFAAAGGEQGLATRAMAQDLRAMPLGQVSLRW
jgi:hypothetical protein